MSGAFTLRISPAISQTRGGYPKRRLTRAIPVADSSQPVEVVIVSGSSRDDTVLRNCLKGSPWSVFSADDVESALSQLQRLTHPIVICSDELESGDWKDVLNRLKSLPAPPPFILATAAMDSRTWAEALQFGACEVVARPFELEEVLHVVRTTYLRSREFAHAVAAGVK